VIRQSGTTLQDIFNLAFGLIGLIPYLLAVYLLIGFDVDITTGLMMMAATAFCSHLLGLLLLRKQGEKLHKLSQQAARLADFKSGERIDFSGKVPEELFDLTSSFNTMIDKMEKSRANQREATTKIMLYARDIADYQKKLEDEVIIRARLARYVGGNVVERIMRAEGDLPLQNINCDVTILFADIRSFTALSEQMSPEQVITMLNEYFDAMANIIFEHDGVLDKFIGDELMAVFGPLGTPEEAPANAVKAALAMQDKVAQLMVEHGNSGLPVFEIGIGINTGDVVIGNVGSKHRMDYTVIGDAVNVAARFEQIAEGGKVVIGETTRRQCESALKVESMGKVKVRNRSEPVSCYQVVGVSL